MFDLRPGVHDHRPDPKVTGESVISQNRRVREKGRLSWEKFLGRSEIGKGFLPQHLLDLHDLAFREES